MTVFFSTICACVYFSMEDSVNLKSRGTSLFIGNIQAFYERLHIARHGAFKCNFFF